MINSVSGHDLAWACKQFEAHFLETVLKQARQSSLGDPLAKSAASRTFRELLDAELANNMAQAGGVGIAELLQSQLAEKK
jgi:flagellar protein FlgJ